MVVSNSCAAAGKSLCFLWSHHHSSFFLYPLLLPFSSYPFPHMVTNQAKQNTIPWNSCPLGSMRLIIPFKIWYKRNKYTHSTRQSPCVMSTCHLCCIMFVIYSLWVFAHCLFFTRCQNLSVSVWAANTIGVYFILTTAVKWIVDYC